MGPEKNLLIEAAGIGTPALKRRMGMDTTFKNLHFKQITGTEYLEYEGKRLRITEEITCDPWVFSINEHDIVYYFGTGKDEQGQDYNIFWDQTVGQPLNLFSAASIKRKEDKK